MLRVTPALQNILEKSVRELGAIRLIDSRVGVPGQLACNPEGNLRAIQDNNQICMASHSRFVSQSPASLHTFRHPSNQGIAWSLLLLVSAHRHCWVSWCCLPSSPSLAWYLLLCIAHKSPRGCGLVSRLWPDLASVSAWPEHLLLFQSTSRRAFFHPWTVERGTPICRASVA